MFALPICCVSKSSATLSRGVVLRRWWNCETHGVSISTMERAYSLLEQEGLLQREQGRGTFVMKPPEKPRSLIAISLQMMPDLQNPYWGNLLVGVNEGAREKGIEVLFSYDADSSIAERTDGLIVTNEPREVFQDLPPDFPLVSLISPMDKAICVLADDHGGVLQLTRHLIELGHRRIAYFSGPLPGMPIIDARNQGFKDALEEAGIDLDPEAMRVQVRIFGAATPLYTASGRKIESKWLYEDWVAAGYEGMKKWLSEDWYEKQYSAVMAYNDGMAIGVIRALREAGLDVPGDVSVTGFDGTPAFDFHSPRITTARVPLSDMGYVGLEFLWRRLQGEHDLPPVTRLPVTLIQGESTGPCSTG
jgi:DNA-binding LacI/PurR family transcriptional regulator